MRATCNAAILAASLLLGLSACALPPNYEADKHSGQDAPTGSLISGNSQDTGAVSGAQVPGSIVSPGQRGQK